MLDWIEMGKVVPIVGRRLSMIDTGAEQPARLYPLLTERLAKELKADPLPEGAGLADLHRSMASRDDFEPDTFHFKLKRALLVAAPHLETLRRLVEIGHFRLFLSTALDGFLGRAVREVRGARGESVSVYTFAPGSLSPQQPIAQRGEVCVYNLLGGLDTCPRWAVSVEEQVEFVLDLHSEKYRPEQLFAALKDKHLLAIGCQIPDWMGRFFLRTLRSGPLWEQKGSSLLVEDLLDADAGFERFLLQSGKKALVVPDDPVRFVDDLYRRWQVRVGNAPPAALEDGPSPPPPPPPPPAGKVFLSYAHFDSVAATKLCEFLVAQGIDVWKDDRDLKGGANWNAEIRSEIAECACFVPLVSKRAVDTRVSYFWEEWNYAAELRRRMNPTARYIFPVVFENDAKLPGMFSDWQSTMLNDEARMRATADELRAEQRRLRKEAR
ncbi:toll/interleukin-1 receptor domain-containing protein [Variovorax sp. J22R115]|uniref:toll/interleukin-1 receptor domain-containing protein n=1 Tax=Variovorax sp. J22R115 TaxID=3053509 RepID=UPI002575174F|nr:toll/interleukin-1 receptor domain-containing protein [Variovorax sp. J22R115]MDM0053546.1 toll/interleukin-1 receptor domain-containing protein [Variovorax sp. J22R115]